jgi:hypothetical protein
MVRIRVPLLPLFLWAGAVSAEVVWDQPWDGKSGGFIAQDFSDSAKLSAYELDDFNLAKPYYIDKITAPGFEAGTQTAPGAESQAGRGPRLWVDAAEILDAASAPGPDVKVQNNAVVGEIWEGLPGSFGGRKVMGSVSGGEEVETGTVVLNFGGQRLPPGQYWLSVYVVRPLASGQWFWLSTAKVRGSEHYFYSRGKAYGVGPDPVPASDVPYAEEQVKTDMAFTIQGRPAGEAGAAEVPQAPGVLPSTAPPAGQAAPAAPAAPGEVPPTPPAAPPAGPRPETPRQAPAEGAQPVPPAVPGPRQARPSPPRFGGRSTPPVGLPPMALPPMVPMGRPVPPPPEPAPVKPENAPRPPSGSSSGP